MNRLAESEKIDNRKRSPPVPRLRVLVLIFGLTLVTGLYVQIWRPWQMRQEAIRRIEARGGYVRYEAVGPEWLRMLTGRHAFGFANPKRGGILDRVISVKLGSGSSFRTSRRRIPPELIHWLGVFPDLQHLDLSFTDATDDWIPEIATLESLQTLDLNSTDVTGRAFQHLAEMRNLNRLSLEGCPIRDESLECLAESKSLERVNLWDCSHLTIDAVSDLQIALPDCQFRFRQSPPPSSDAAAGQFTY